MFGEDISDIGREGRFGSQVVQDMAQAFEQLPVAGESHPVLDGTGREKQAPVFVHRDLLTGDGIVRGSISVLKVSS